MDSRRFRRLVASVAAVAFAAVLAVPAPAAILPAWSLTGTNDLQMDVGFRSVDAQYEFTLEGLDGSVTLAYSPKGGLTGAGLIGFDFVALRGTYWVGEDGVQNVVVEENARRPSFRFQGLVDELRGDFVGTYERSEGFAGLASTASGPLTIARTPATAPVREWRLRISTSMDRKGRVRGGVAQDGSEDRARVTLFGGAEVSGGLVRGRLRTFADGTTTARLRVVGRNWRMRMAGPVDVDEFGVAGFHALADIFAGGFRVFDVPVTLAVGPGPEPPPPPTPKLYRVAGATATIVGDRVAIQRNGVNERVFGRRANVVLTFPLADSNSTVVADPTTAADPPGRTFTAFAGPVTYGTSASPAVVTFAIQRTSTTSFVVLCSGTVANSTGTKTRRFSLELTATAP